jgi:hypothetical protein
MVSVIPYVARLHLCALPERSPDWIVTMTHRLLADAVLLLDFDCFASAVGGALLVARWPPLAWLHLPRVSARWARGELEFQRGLRDALAALLGKG